MSMIERDGHFSAISLGGFVSPFKTSRIDLCGSAILSFPDGKSVRVDATATRSRSTLSLSGEGQLRCTSDIGFDALGMEEWATLQFSCRTILYIKVYDLKVYSNGLCRCLFEVMA